MNKLFTKIASLSVGLALVVGVGVAASRRGSVAKVEATEAVAYTLTPAVTGNTTYVTDDYKSATISGVEWVVEGNGSVNNGSWRLGGKSTNTVDADRRVYSKDAVSTEDITKVELKVGAASGITVNSLNLLVGTSAGGAETNTVVGTFVASSTITFEKPSGAKWSSKHFAFKFNLTSGNASSNKFVEFTEAKFYYESTTPRGEIAPNDLDTPVFVKNGSKSLSYQWTPAQGSSATITSHSWVSSDTTIATVSGDTCTAVGTGVFTLTLNATDSNSEVYSVQTRKYFVTNSYDFEINDLVALYSEGSSVELTAINKSGSTHYGEGTAYSSKPNGTYPLTVEAGSATGSFAFVNDGNYLSWSSGNSLTTSTTKSENTSWYVIVHDEYTVILNAAQNPREIWWNSSNPRFACYTDKTPSSSGYTSVALSVIEEVPVRGTIVISNPTATLMRKGTVDQATYSWTPAEGSSATISTATWSSSNSSVISVSGNTYTVVAPGKAKLTLNATDSTGQEYTVSTSDITVVDVVSGSYEKKYSVALGDTIAIVCDTEETQFAGIASNYGTYVFYNTAPADIYDFTLEEGNQSNSYALANSEGKYLNWTSDAKFSLEETVTDNSSWNISFDGDGNAIIENCALDGEDHRVIMWNHNSPRFAPYKPGQTPVQIYGPATALDPSAVTFANKIIEELTCDATGKTAPSVSEWGDLEEALVNVTSDGKEQLRTIKAIHHESPSTDREVVEEALAKYDYIVGKYGESTYTDFLNRDPDPIPGGVNYRLDNNASANSTMIIVIVIAAASAIMLSTLLIIKKKKHN